jgi:hypothetical protein
MRDWKFQQDFHFEYYEVKADHGGMVPLECCPPFSTSLTDTGINNQLATLHFGRTHAVRIQAAGSRFPSFCGLLPSVCRASPATPSRVLAGSLRSDPLFDLVEHHS